MKRRTITIRRRPAAAIPGRGQVCGAAEVDITPNLGLAMAGYSVEAKRGFGVQGRLFARALYLEDAAGQRAALCYIDLMSGSRYVLERVASITAPVCGIAVDRLLLAGTHTHTAPGHFYGNSLFDSFAQSKDGFDQEWTDWLAEQIARAIIDAAAAAVPARLAVRQHALWGITQNRSFGAFRANFVDPAAWNQAGFPGHGAPPLPRLRRRAIDPRVTVLTAVRDDASLLGVFATFGCHSTCMGNALHLYSSDWPGYAVRRARASLSPQQAVIAVALSAAGDVNGLQRREPEAGDPAEEVPEALQEQGAALAQYVGDQVGQVIADVAGQAAAAAEDFTLDMRYAEPAVAERVAGNDERTRLARRWYIGWPALGGSEDGRTPLHRAIGLIREGLSDQHVFPPGEPQHPKASAVFLPFLQDWVTRDCLRLRASPVFPIHTLRLNQHLFATVPGEPTTVAAFRIERALQDATGLAGVTVVGYAGDYSAYFTTEEEYRAQHYEGAMTLYGRNSTRHMIHRLVELVSGAAPPPLPEADIRFEYTERRRSFVSAGEQGHEPPAPEPVAVLVLRSGQRIGVKFFTRTAQVFFASNYFLRLEQAFNGTWQPVILHGRPFDDRYQDIRIAWTSESFLRFDKWEIDFVLPDGLAPAPLRLHFPPRPHFKALTAAIPDGDGISTTQN